MLLCPTLNLNLKSLFVKCDGCLEKTVCVIILLFTVFLSSTQVLANQELLFSYTAPVLCPIKLPTHCAICGHPRQKFN